MKKKLGVLLVIVAVLVGVVGAAFTTPEYCAKETEWQRVFAEMSKDWKPGTIVSCSGLSGWLELGDPDGFINYLADRNEHAATVNGVKGKVPEEFIKLVYDHGEEIYGPKGSLKGYEAQLQAMGYNVGSTTTVSKEDMKNNTTSVSVETNATPATSGKTITPYPQVKIVYAKENVAFFDKPEPTAKAMGFVKGTNAIAVTGITADGWYEILFTDGGKAYTPAGFFTEEQPK